MKLRPKKLAEDITAEIDRVSAKRERETAVARAAGAVGEVRPALYMMDQAMHFGRKAREGRCTAEMAIALAALRDIR